MHSHHVIIHFYNVIIVIEPEYQPQICVLWIPLLYQKNKYTCCTEVIFLVTKLFTNHFVSLRFWQSKGVLKYTAKLQTLKFERKNPGMFRCIHDTEVTSVKRIFQAGETLL